MKTEQTMRLVKREWRSYYDDVQEKSVSDWDRSEECARCGRQIVHLNIISDGESTRAVGIECLHVELGLPRRVTESRARRLLFDAQREQERIDGIKSGIQRAAATPELAWDAMAKACGGRPQFGPNASFLALLHGPAGYLYARRNDAEVLATEGYTPAK